MRRPPKPSSRQVSRQPAAPPRPASAELESRIERLEKRLEEATDEHGMLNAPQRTELDAAERDDPLRRAVERVRDRRES